MRRRTLALIGSLAVCSLVTLTGCGSDLSLAPVNRDPMVQSLLATPAALSPGDSAFVVCHATDPDGDQVQYDWVSFGPVSIGGDIVFNGGDTRVVHALKSPVLALDTGWVQCFVRDGRGGGADAGRVPIIVQQ